MSEPSPAGGLLSELVIEAFRANGFLRGARAGGRLRIGRGQRVVEKLQAQIDAFLDSLRQAKAAYAILGGTPGGGRQLDETRAHLGDALSEIRRCRQQLRDEIVLVSGELGHRLPPAADTG